MLFKNKNFIANVRSRDQTQDSVRIDLELNLKNFGPVKKGIVHLKPLTIFVGPNNSGKSYVARLIHSILSSENQFHDIDDYPPMRLLIRPYTRSFESELQKLVEKNKEKDSFSVPARILKSFMLSYQKASSEDLDSRLSGNFGSPVSELVSAKQKPTKISVLNSPKLDILINEKLNIEINSNLNIKCKIKKSTMNDIYDIKSDKDSITITFNKICTDEDLKRNISHILAFELISKFRHDTIPLHSYYFPAERSGILQAHQVLSASIIENSRFGGIKPLSIPRLTGTISEFLSNIILLPRPHGPFFHLAEQLEKEFFDGHITLSTRKNDTFPEITYSSKIGKIPLHRTSSTISEIAPFSLYLKYIVKRNSLLIIEEPEAHLHPTNQVIFAKYLVKMIRAGLNVLITTHSVFMLEQLGKFMMSYTIGSKKRKKIGYDECDYLSPDEVSPYVFNTGKNSTYGISPIPMDDEYGISQEEFVKVDEQLYSDHLKLQQNLPKN